MPRVHTVPSTRASLARLACGRASEYGSTAAGQALVTPHDLPPLHSRQAAVASGAPYGRCGVRHDPPYQLPHTTPHRVLCRWEQREGRMSKRGKIKPVLWQPVGIWWCAAALTGEWRVARLCHAAPRQLRRSSLRHPAPASIPHVPAAAHAKIKNLWLFVQLQPHQTAPAYPGP